MDIPRGSETRRNRSPAHRYSPDYHQNEDNHNIRNFISFWLLGLCNGYATSVMLSAAYDIIQSFDNVEVEGVNFLGPLYVTKTRDCIPKSTGIFLLADTIPMLIVKSIIPFLPLHIKNVLLALTSGTGAAGVFGAVSYAALIDYGFNQKITLQFMLLIPLFQLMIFHFGIVEPRCDEFTSSLIVQQNGRDSSEHSPDFYQKLRFFPKLLKYIIPLFGVFIFEYIINQGLYDLIFVPNSWLDQANQYRWLQVIYKIGVFMARTSFAFFSIKYIWPMAILQFINAIFFTYQVLYILVPSIWIIFAIVLYEGSLSGFAAMNTYSRVANELPMQFRSFGVSFTVISSTLGVLDFWRFPFIMKFADLRRL